MSRFKSMTPEGRVIVACERLMKELRKSGWPLWWVKLHGDRYQRNGLPDLQICCGGLFVTAEAKRVGSKHVVRPLQRVTMRAQEKAGGTTVVVENELELYAVLTRTYLLSRRLHAER